MQHNENMHLDNKDNKYMRNFLESGKYMTMDSHTLQDFYAHSNYIEIMKENGVADNDMVTFDKLSSNSKLYKEVMAKIETTKFPDDGKKNTPIKKNGHDGYLRSGAAVILHMLMGLMFH